MTFIKGSVAIAAWFVLVVAGFSTVMFLLGGEVASGIVAGLLAWGAWHTIIAVAPPEHRS